MWHKFQYLVLYLTISLGGLLEKDRQVLILKLTIGRLLREIYSFVSSPALHLCTLPLTTVYSPGLLPLHILIVIVLYLTWRIPEDD